MDLISASWLLVKFKCNFDIAETIKKHEKKSFDFIYLLNLTVTARKAINSGKNVFCAFMNYENKLECVGRDSQVKCVQ